VYEIARRSQRTAADPPLTVAVANCYMNLGKKLPSRLAFIRRLFGTLRGLGLWHAGCKCSGEDRRRAESSARRSSPTGRRQTYGRLIRFEWVRSKGGDGSLCGLRPVRWIANVECRLDPRCLNPGHRFLILWLLVHTVSILGGSDLGP
jgi:hypothetical protein